MITKKVFETQNSSVEELSDRLLTVAEAAEILHIRPGTLANWLSQGRYGLRRLKIGGKTLLDSRQVKALLHQILEP
jgi:excisionase family DNA binding protein